VSHRKDRLPNKDLQVIAVGSERVEAVLDDPLQRDLSSDEWSSTDLPRRQQVEACGQVVTGIVLDAPHDLLLADHHVEQAHGDRLVHQRSSAADI
jgi:hypothetical protein